MKFLITLMIMAAMAQTGLSQNLQKESSAILLIEFQKTWTEKGIFHRIIKKEYEHRNVLDNTKALLLYARSKGIKVIQAPLILDRRDVNYRKTPFPARVLKCFTKGTWKAEFTDGIYESTDKVIRGRYGFDATLGSDLENILRENKVETVFVAGFTTDHCVRETMNSLIAKGFECIMIADCTATSSNKLQKKVEAQFTMITSEQFTNKMK